MSFRAGVTHQDASELRGARFRPGARAFGVVSGAMTTTYLARWGSDTVKITADFSQDVCQIQGLHGMRVADFRRRPTAAMRQALIETARADGLDPTDPEVAASIEEALDGMQAHVRHREGDHV